jgi:hypothetical protein
VIRAALVVGLVLTAAAILARSAAASGFDDLDLVPPPYPFDIDFDDPLIHVHPEVNYALHPDWLAAWEEGRLGDGALIGTFGSSATDELLVDARWALNPDLGNGLRLRNDIVWQERRHLPHERQDVWLGLEQRLWRGAGVIVQTVPAEDKEWLDLRLGGVWASADRRRYLQLTYRHDELVFDQKNGRGGRTEQAPAGVDWLARWSVGEWSLFTRGHWLGEAHRTYADPDLSPVIARHQHAANEAVARLRWQPAPRAQLELAWQLVEDAQVRLYRGQDSAYDHRFSGRYRTLSARGLVPLDPRWRLRGEVHQVARRVAVSGWRELRHRRDDWLLATFAEWRWNAGSWVELGYIAAFHDYDDTARGGDAGYGDKVELGAVVGLKQGSAVKVSLSHQAATGGFGGASVRILTWF